MFIHSMSALECTKVLSANRLGRLACSREGQPYVVPIYFAHEGNYLYAFSMPGKKIEWMRDNPRVSVLIEERGKGQEWKSVVVDGRFEELPDRMGHKVERERAWALLSRHSNWWEPGGLKPVKPPVADKSDHVFFRIAIDQMSGRESRES